MVENFDNLMQEALDEVAPLKTFKIRSHHKFGLSEHTKKLMKKRDIARKKISNCNSVTQKC